MRRPAVLVLRLALACLAMSVIAFVATSPSPSQPLPLHGGAADFGRDPFPWEAEGGGEDEFKGPKRNLQTALVSDDVFTLPRALQTTVSHPPTTPSPTEHVHHKRSRFNYTVVQQVRQRALDAACRERTITRDSWRDLTQTQQSAIAERIIVNEEHKLLFCPVPLTAIGPWMKVLYLLGPGRDLKSTDDVPSSELSQRTNFVYLSSFSPEEQEEKVDTYLKFMVTRHPFFRLAAAYKMKFEADNAFFHERYGREIVRLYRSGATGEETGSDVKFSEFVEYLLHLGAEGEMNEHWKPLEALCLPCQLGYNYLLHYETLAADSREMLGEAGLQRRVPSLPRDTWDHIPTQYMQRLFQQVSPAWVGQLVQHYQHDFNMFSYGSIL